MRTADGGRQSRVRGGIRPLLFLVAAASLVAVALSLGFMVSVRNEPANVFDEMLDDGLDCMKNVDGLTWSADPHNMFDTPSVELTLRSENAPGEAFMAYYRLTAKKTDAILLFRAQEHHALGDGGCVHVNRRASYDQAHTQLILCWPEYSYSQHCGEEQESVMELGEAEALALLEENGEHVGVEETPNLEMLRIFVSLYLEQIDRSAFTHEDWGAYDILVRSA